MKSIVRTPEDNQIAQLENEVTRLNKKISKYEAIELKQNRFGLVWLDVPEAFEDDVENKLPILEEVPKLAINSKDDKPTHLLIEGDNYHALTCLNYTHKGKVDVIYIDPPYNTGSDSFRYKDKRILSEFPDGTEVPVDHPLRHSYWLSFMRKRLELAKDLLKDKGVIFVSIDDNELAQLKLLMDEIFDKNFVAQFIHKNNSTKNQANLVSVSTEYILLYSKTNDGLKGVKWRVEKKGAKDIAKMYESLKKKGLNLGEVEEQIKEMYTRPKYTHLSRWNKVDKKGVFVDADLSREDGSKDYTIDNPKTKKPCLIPERGWGKSHEELLRLQKEDLIWYGDESTPPRMKVYITEENFMVPDNFLYFDNSVDTRMIKQMFGKLVFENPKPLEMIKTIIKISSNEEAVVLDFFAGSGTTGQAVMDLNDEDKGKRKFILVTDNENKIMSEVCYPRIKKVIKGYDSTAGLGNSIRYFKTAFVGKNNILKADDADKIELAHNAGGMLAVAENTFDQVESNNHWQIFESSKQYTAVYFREDFGKFDDFIEKVKNFKKTTVVYIFSWEKEFEFNEFEGNKNIMIKTIPQPILEIYKQIYNLV